MKNMIILGSEGYLGKTVQKHFSGKYNMICLDKKLKKHTIDTNIVSLEFDISNSNTYCELFSLLEENNFKVDAIVNLVGINSISNFYDISKETWNHTMETNLSAFLFFLKGIYRFLNKEVSIVAIASQNGVVAHENRIDYGTSKAALIHLIKNLTIDFLQDKEKDIKINCISPTYIRNESNEYYFSTHEGKKLLKKIPYGRLLDNEDVVNTLEFLISDKSRAIRGQNIIIDYGYTIV
ncbi:TPA: SDR family oxidoreductase [Bacillus cereus]|nr:SDR family oxidoreductase [Bacillus cereus]HDR4743800.1 SDR family oxidoreductase [Bacillus cereus]HDR4749645.1 SDR family oxidoreductase [Bacillus cereus]HDR4754957.1 SDR family oxidoreductase [Bacillus cereus]HDR4771932.1 SDR family oxidoreductase [Bacillus cereus]